MEDKFVEDFAKFKNSIGDASKMFDGILSNLVPQTAPKKVEIEIVERKGFCGIGRKVKKYPVDAYISMNSLLILDFKDKGEMKVYFDGL